MDHDFVVVQLSSRLEIAALALLAYDCLLTSFAEPRLWRRPLARPSLLFFAVRYLPLLASLALLLLGYVPSLAPSCPTLEWCVKVKLLLTQVFVCLLMGLRVMAMYYNDRRIVLLVGAVGAVLLAATIVVVVYDERTQVFVFVGLGVRICQTALFDTRDAFAWVMQVVWDVFVLLLTVLRTLASWREDGHRGGRKSLADLMFRDGILFYVVITLSNVANILTFFLGPPLARGCLSTLASAISTTMLARLTLHLHAAVERTARSSRSLEMDVLVAPDAGDSGEPDARRFSSGVRAYRPADAESPGAGPSGAGRCPDAAESETAEGGRRAGASDARV